VAKKISALADGVQWVQELLGTGTPFLWVCRPYIGIISVEL
jgi:hypothetical protein